MKKIILTKEVGLIDKVEQELKRDNIKFWSYPLNNKGAWYLVIDNGINRNRFSGHSKQQAYQKAAFKLKYGYELELGYKDLRHERTEYLDDGFQVDYFYEDGKYKSVLKKRR